MTYPRYFPTLLTLADGRVLALGGTTYPETPDTSFIDSVIVAEAYDPTTDTWSDARNGQYFLYRSLGFRAALLPSGRVLLAGGSQQISCLPAYGNPCPGELGGFYAGYTLASAEIFDPFTNTWRSAAHDMPVPREAFEMVTLPSGEVLVTGGFNRFINTTSDNDYQLPSLLFNENTESWSITTSLAVPQPYSAPVPGLARNVPNSQPGVAVLFRG